MIMELDFKEGLGMVKVATKVLFIKLSELTQSHPKKLSSYVFFTSPLESWGVGVEKKWFPPVLDEDKVVNFFEQTISIYRKIVLVCLCFKNEYL